MQFRNKTVKIGSASGSASSLMDDAKKWVARLVADRIITCAQGKRLLSSHCSVLGRDGKSYGLSFDPSKQNTKIGHDADIDGVETRKRKTIDMIKNQCEGRNVNNVRCKNVATRIVKIVGYQCEPYSEENQLICACKECAEKIGSTPMELIDKSSPLYLKRLVRELNAHGFIDGFFADISGRSVRCDRARIKKGILQCHSWYLTPTWFVPSNHYFVDPHSREIVASQKPD